MGETREKHSELGSWRGRLVFIFQQLEQKTPLLYYN
jgi:hypothetical protein